LAKFSVLIVDDEEEIRNALGRCLRREGYELHFAAGAAEALEVLQRREIDLVLTDHRMPDMTGLELIITLKETHPDVLRVILTGCADFETIKAAINEAEIFRFLTKPWDDDDLRITLRSARQRRELERENRRLLATLRRQQNVLAELEKTHPGITKLERDEDGAIVISLDDE
jgi:two-component system probable response regulator PhcQ